MQAAMGRLVKLTQWLRANCPWTREQTYRSIAPYTLEEAYEVIDAIERDDKTALKSELADLLYQVMLYSEFAREEGRFDFKAVIEACCEKHERRNQALLDSPDGLTAADILSNWAAKKQQEKSADLPILADIPVQQPAILRAEKLQARAAEVGFDWPEISGVLAKLQEELAELNVEIESGDSPARLEDELGDVFFVMVNLARRLNCNAEQCLRVANTKFVRRFSFVEEQVRKSGLPFSEQGFDTLEDYWQAAKKLES